VLPLHPLDCAATDGLCEVVHVTGTDRSSAETGFKILRSGEIVGTAPADATAFDDTTSIGGVRYLYQVLAFNDCGDSVPSNADEGHSTFDPPRSATNCQASDDRCALVRVTWYDNSDDETGFRISRDGLPIGIAPANAEMFDDDSAETDVTYSYEVTALSECGEATPSNADDGRRIELDDPVVPILESPVDGAECLVSPVTFTWSGSGTSYQLQIGRTCGGQIVVDEEVGTTEATVSVPLGELHWRVRARNACYEWSPWTPCLTVTIIDPSLTAPDGFIACPLTGSLWSFEWSAVPGATNYVVTISDLCHTWTERAVQFTVAATDTVIDLGHYGFTDEFEAWVYATACGRQSDPSECSGRWDCAGGGVPVLLDHFRARVLEGRVALEWATRREEDVAGFHVYRRPERDEAEVRLTPQPIAAGRVDYSFFDTTARPGMAYVYRLAEVTTSGHETSLGELRVVAPVVPVTTVLYAPRPNPSDRVVHIACFLANAGVVRIDVLDSAGRLVRRLVDRTVPPGALNLQWDGHDTKGLPVGSGKFFVRLTTAGHRMIETITLIR
jgi:hypothetical protein